MSWCGKLDSSILPSKILVANSLTKKFHVACSVIDADIHDIGNGW
jgi:hypothetical protein